MIIKHGRHILAEIHEVRKGLWAFFLDCAFRMLIGWTGELRSRGMEDTKIQLRNAEFWFRLYVSLFTSMQPS